MEDNNYGNYGVSSGYGQPTAGRQAARLRQQGQPGRPPSAAPAPAQAPQPQVDPAQPKPFQGAIQTLGAAMGADKMRERTHGGPGFDGAANWMSNAMGAAPIARGPQAVPSQTGPYEQGGVAGAMPAVQPPVQQPAAAPDFSRVAGYDQAKWDANKQDAKYQMGRTLAQFDPRQGITPEVIAALNGLGYGTFSGQGDKLSLSGLTDLGRQNKLSGDYTGADFIQGFKSGNGKWGYADPVAEAAQAGGAPAAMSPELLAMLGGGGMSQQTAQPVAPGAPDQQFNTERMRAMIMQALQGGQIR
jgi:hypothetical protein